MAAKRAKHSGRERKLTGYTSNEIRVTRVSETGHTELLPADEQGVALPMDNGGSQAIQVGNESTPVRELGS